MLEEVADEALLRRFLDGEEGMFEALAERHAGPLQGFFFRKTGSVHASEDLLQETLIRLYRKGRDFRGEGSLRSWIYTVALHLVRSRSRSRARLPLPATTGPAEALARGRAGPEERVISSELGETIRKAVEALPVQQQEVFILRHYQDLPFSEIGRVLNISPGASRAHMHRALTKLRKKLGFLRL